MALKHVDLDITMWLCRFDITKCLGVDALGGHVVPQPAACTTFPAAFLFSRYLYFDREPHLDCQHDHRTLSEHSAEHSEMRQIPGYAEGRPYYGPLNIHYHDLVVVELDDSDPSPVERTMECLESINLMVHARLNAWRKRLSREQAICQRQKTCKLAWSENMTTKASPRPTVTRFNLDQSPFLSLPIELREQIYEYYYRDHEVRIQDLSYDGTYLLTVCLLYTF